MTTNKQRFKYLFLLFAWLTTMSLQAQNNGDIVGPPNIDDPTLTHTVTVGYGTDGTNKVGGTITPVGLNYNTDGTTVTVLNDSKPTFRINAADGYRIASIAITEGDAANDIGDMTTEYSYIFSKGVNKNASISVVFSETRFTLLASVKEGKGGTITPTRAVVPRGGSQIFTITPAEGFTLNEVTDNSVKVTTTPTITGATYTLSNIQEAHVIKASFKATEYAVTFTSNSTGGSLEVKDGAKTVNTEDKIAHGSVLSLTASPNAGYELAYFTANGTRLTGTTWTVKGAVTLAAVFQKKILTVTVDIPEKGGTFMVAKDNTSLLPGQHQMEYGTQLTLTNQPATGYTFAKYVVDGAEVTSSSYTVEKSVKINTVFTADKYPVTVASSTDGKLTFDGTDASTGNYDYGTVLTLGNKPDEGKTFASYTVNPSSALNGNLLTVTGTVTVGVTFKDIPGGSEVEDPNNPDGKLYKVTFPSSLTVMNNGVAISSGTMVKANAVLSLIAANTHTQQLKSLTANGSTVDFFTSGGMNTALHTVTGAVEFACAFATNEFPVSIDAPIGGTLSATAGSVAVVPGTKYPYGTVIRVTATPASNNYKLSRILGNGRDITQTKQVTLTEDLLLSAIFTLQPGIDPDKDPDPSNPSDPSKPSDPAGTIYIDRTPQQVVYNGNEQAYYLITLPGGVLNQVTITYLQSGKTVRPKEAGSYDVRLTRAADDSFNALDVTLSGAFTIRKAPVTITDVKYEQTPWTSIPGKTTATLNEVTAESQGKAVAGTFAWETGGKEKDVTTSGYNTVIFTPTDTKNYETPVQIQVYVQVGTAPATTYTLTLETEGQGTISAWNGSMLCNATKPLKENQVITIKATPAEGYRLKGFREEEAVYILHPYEVTMTQNRTVTAVFEKKQDPSNPSNPSDPSAPSAGLGVKIDFPSSLVYDGSPKLVSVTSTPTVSGWLVMYRNEAGETVIPVDAGNYTVTVIRAEDDTYAGYQKTLTYTIQKATPTIHTQPSASVVPTGAPLSESVLSGGICKVADLGIIPGMFEWSAPTTVVSAKGDQTFRFVPVDTKNINNVMGSTEVSVINSSTPIPIYITYSQATGGHLSVTYEEGPNASKVISSGTLVLAGTKIRIRVISESGYELQQFTYGGTDCTADFIIGDLVRTVYTSKVLAASFKQISSPVDPDNPGGNGDNPGGGGDYPGPDYSDRTVWVRSEGLGSITPGTSRVVYGGSLFFEITPGYGQQIVDVRVNGNSVGAVTKYQLKNIYENKVVEAVFSNAGIPVHTLTSRTFGGGSVIPTIVRLAEGSNHQFVLYPRGDAKIADVQIGTTLHLESIGKPSSYIFRNVTADSLLIASFTWPTANETTPSTVKDKMLTRGQNLYIYSTTPTTTIQIYRIDGSLILTRRITEGCTIMQLPTGIYVAEIRGEKSSLQQKIRIR